MTASSRVILIVEDDPNIRRILRTALELEPFRVLEAENGQRALIEARSHRPDLIIVDLGLPDIDGTEVIRHIREWSLVPLIVLSARSEEAQKVLAFELGADDYVTKPFGTRELLARVRVALRHNVRLEHKFEPCTIGRWSVDIPRRRITDGQTELHLTPIEFRLLEALIKHAGMVVTHRALLQSVWGPNCVEQTHYLRGYMKQLRHKLERDPVRPKHLLTETGIGYRLLTDDQ